MNRQTVLYDLYLFQLEGVIDTLVFPTNDFQFKSLLIRTGFHMCGNEREVNGSRHLNEPNGSRA
jgi:hypothetical protein